LSAGARNGERTAEVSPQSGGEIRRIGTPVAASSTEQDMSYFSPELIQTMRDALDQVMTRVPVEYATPATKAYLAECILKAAAQGQTSCDALVSAAADHIQTIVTVFT
jgi:hypothetical protein